MLLPLKTLVDVPWDSMILVVDNARSPMHAVSAVLTKAAPVLQRDFSLDSDIGNKPGNRWSSIPFEHADGNRSSLPQTPLRGRKSTPLRRRSFDDILEETVGASSTPARIPVRHLSPSPSPAKKTNNGKIAVISLSSSLLPNRKPTPLRMRSSIIEETIGASTTRVHISVRYTMPCKTDTSGSNQPSRDHNSTNFWKLIPYNISPDLERCTTTNELLAKALEE
jgi:hypothetical protein